jgi:S1-C subfamily serine protease
MVAGKLIVPPAETFGPCFKPVSKAEQPFDLGFDEMRLGVVKDLRPDSAAAKAGIREGDAILSMTPLDAVRNDPQKKMELKLKRGNEEINVSYLPRRVPVPAWHWVRDHSVPDNDCHL